MPTTSPKVTKIEIFDLQVIFLATIIIVRDVPPVLSSVNPVILATISDVDVRVGPTPFAANVFRHQHQCGRLYNLFHENL